MLKIRLSRIGTKKKPFYRVVAVDERAKRTGAYIELLGTYNPLTEPKDIKLKKDRIDYWIKQGAQPSTGYLRIIGKAPQRPLRKPKKEKSSVVSPQSSDNQTKESTKVEQTEQVEEAKADASKVEESAVPTAEQAASETETKKEVKSES